MMTTKKICAILLVLLLLIATVPTGFAATKNAATTDEAVIKNNTQTANTNKELAETGTDVKIAQTGSYFKTDVGKTYYTAVHGAVTGKITRDSYWYDLNDNPIKFKQNASPFYAGEPLTVVRLSKTDPTTNSKYSFAATTDAYCIQPGTELGAVGVKATDTSKSVYANFSSNVKNAISLALYYGLPGQGKSSACSNETVQQGATQVVLWELIKNYRSSNIDKSKSGDGNFVRSNGALYNGVVSSYSELKSEYGNIVTGLQRHYKIPSFMRFAENKAQTVTLAYDSATNKYTAKVKDSNWVLYDKNGHSTINFTNKDGVTFKKDGYYLTITSTKPIEKAITVTATKTFNAPKQNGTLVTFDPTGNQQDVISGVATTPTKITAYLKIKTDNAVGNLELNKSSSNPQITDGNSCYSLSGAEYEIYDENNNLIDTIVTDDEGMGHITGLKIGKYTVKETKASKGYAVDVTTHEVTIEAGKTTVLNVKEVPQNDPVQILLRKYDSETKTGLSGAEFTINYYKDFYQTEDELKLVQPERHWIFITDEDGYSTLDKEYKLSGDDFFYFSGYEALPLGTITIQETKAPAGYVIDNSLRIMQITSNNSGLEIVYTYNAPEIPNTPQKSGVKIVKTSEDSKVKDVYFNIKTNTQDIGNFATNDNGELDINDLNVYDDNGELIEYTITELGDKQADGTYKLNNKYTVLESKTVTLSYGEITTVSFKNRLKKGSVTLHKQNQNGDGIKGAEFALYKADGTQLSAIQNGAGSFIASPSATPITLTTDDNGNLSVSQLQQGEYYFIETKAPYGYMIYDKKIPFTVSAEETDNTLNAEVTVKNNKVLLYNTGNSGNTIYFVIASLAALSALALFTVLIIKKRKDKKNMKKVSTFMLSLALALITVFSIATPKFAAETTTPLDTTQKVSFTVNCDKKGYIFEVYKIGALVQNSTPYEVKYESLVPEISDSILNGDTASMLAALDETTTIPTTVIGSCNSTIESRKTFSDLTQGIYYVRATSYPAGVKSVTNSVFALPYYSNGWQYTIDEINLAQKVNDDVPEIVKTITNSTKNNVNYTDVSLQETVNFEIKSTTAGSNQIKLKEYIITDDMSKGLTLDKTSFDVTLQDQYGKQLNKLTNSDYAVKINSEAEGQNTVFTVSVSSEYLQKSDFYNALYVSVKYSATLNKYAVTGFDGNPNTVKNLKYTNKFDVSAEIEGNTVYVYTYGVLLNKYNEVGQKLSGAEFGLYKTEADAKDEKNAIASGISDNEGKTVFKTSGNEIKLQSGTYYIKETKAPSGYNKYTDVIPVEITAKYGNEFVNNTYLTSAPENGIATVEVKNSKTLLPQTGGNALFVLYVVAGVTGVTALALFAVLLIKRKFDLAKGN